MPLFYDLGLSANTSGSTNTEVDHILGIAGATQGYGIIAVTGNIRTGVTVGAAALRVKTGATSAAGTPATANKRNPSNPATGSSWSTAITAAGSPIVRESIGLSQVGLPGAWVAVCPDDAIQVLPGVTNKGEVYSIANTATQGADMQVKFSEGSGGT